MARCGNSNYMDQLYDIISAIENTKPEPEVCNTRCPPLGCPKGLCIGMCCYRGICDACCTSRMPCRPPVTKPPSCSVPRCLSRARQPCAHSYPADRKAAIEQYGGHGAHGPRI